MENVNLYCLLEEEMKKKNASLKAHFDNYEIWNDKFKSKRAGLIKPSVGICDPESISLYISPVANVSTEAKYVVSSNVKLTSAHEITLK